MNYVRSIEHNVEMPFLRFKQRQMRMRMYLSNRILHPTGKSYMRGLHFANKKKD